MPRSGLSSFRKGALAALSLVFILGTAGSSYATPGASNQAAAAEFRGLQRISEQRSSSQTNHTSVLFRIR